MTHALGDPGHLAEHNALPATYVAQGAQAVSVKDAAYGAKGDGATNDTAALNAATAAGGLVFVPNGTYLCDGWVISQKTHLVFAPGAVIRQRVAPTLTGGVGSLLRFTTGSDGSIVENARLDGNRDALAGSFVSGNFWLGLRIENINDVAVIGGEFFNTMGHGVYVTGASDNSPSTQIVIRDIYVHNCSQALCVVAVQDSLINNIRAVNISNTGYAAYQHGFEFRLLDRTDIRGLYLKNFYPDGSALDTLSLGIDASRIDNDCSISDVHLDDYSGTGHLSLGISLAGARNLRMDNIHVTNFHAGINLATVQNSQVSGLFIDNAYKASNSYGLLVSGAGYVADLVVPDSHYNAPSSKLVIADSVICRAVNGVQSSAREVTYDSVISRSNSQYGYLIHSTADNSPSFPGQNVPRADNVVLDNCSAIANGYSGLYADTNTDVTVLGGNYINNGQATGGPDRDGIHSVAPSNEVTVLASPGLYDDQNWSKVNGGSILPGVYAGGQVAMLMLDTTYMHVGQNIIVKNIGGPSVDATVQITDIVGDTVLFNYTGTISDSGNLVALTGTVASDAATITGTGTHFTTEITGPGYVKISGGYPIVRQVFSDTSALITGGAVVAAGATASRVAFTVNAVPSQQNGITLSGVFQEALIERITDRSNVLRSYNYTLANLAGAKPKTLLTVISTAVSVSGGASAAVSQGIPPGWRIVGFTITITTAISGGAVTSYDLKMLDGGVTKDTYVTTRPLTVGAESHFANGSEIFTNGVLWMFFNGGSPTAGVVTTETMFERCGI